MQALQRLGIEALAQRGICTISGGERQLALIARALVQNAEILIMDEPTSSLTEKEVNHLFKLMRALLPRNKRRRENNGSLRPTPPPPSVAGLNFRTASATIPA